MEAVECGITNFHGADLCHLCPVAYNVCSFSWRMCANVICYSYLRTEQILTAV